MYVQLFVQQVKQLVLAVLVAVGEEAGQEVHHDVLAALQQHLTEVGQDILLVVLLAALGGQQRVDLSPEQDLDLVVADSHCHVVVAAPRQPAGGSTPAPPSPPGSSQSSPSV